MPAGILGDESDKIIEALSVGKQPGPAVAQTSPPTRTRVDDGSRALSASVEEFLAYSLSGKWPAGL